MTGRRGRGSRNWGFNPNVNPNVNQNAQTGGNPQNGNINRAGGNPTWTTIAQNGRNGSNNDVAQATGNRNNNQYAQAGRVAVNNNATQAGGYPQNNVVQATGNLNNQYAQAGRVAVNNNAAQAGGYSQRNIGQTGGHPQNNNVARAGGNPTWATIAQSGRNGQNNGVAQTTGNRTYNQYAQAGRVAVNNNATQAGGYPQRNMGQTERNGQNNAIAQTGGNGQNGNITRAGGNPTYGAIAQTGRNGQNNIVPSAQRPNANTNGQNNIVPSAQRPNANTNGPVNANVNRRVIVNLPQGPGHNITNIQAIQQDEGRVLPQYPALVDYNAPEVSSAGMRNFVDNRVLDPIKINLPAIATWQKFSAIHIANDVPRAALDIVSRTPFPVDPEDFGTGGSVNGAGATGEVVQKKEGEVPSIGAAVVTAEPKKVDTAVTTHAPVANAPRSWAQVASVPKHKIAMKAVETPKIGESSAGNINTANTNTPTVQGHAQPGVGQTGESNTQTVHGQVQPGVSANGGSNSSTVNNHVENTNSQAVRGQVQPGANETGESNASNTIAENTSVQTVQGQDQPGVNTFGGIPKDPAPAVIKEIDWTKPLHRHFDDPKKQEAYDKQVEQAKRIQKRLQKEKTTQLRLPIELWLQIVPELDPRSRRAFAISCKDAARVVNNLVIQWDVHAGEYDGDEKTVNGDPVNKPLDLHRTVIVRGGNRLDRYRGHEIRGMQKLTLALSNMRPAIKQLELHNLPLLSCDLLARVLPEMRMLEYLGIYRCPLIGVLALEQLIPILQRGPSAREKRAVPLQLDFYPGARHEYARTVHYIVALPALLYELLPAAKAANSQLCARGGNFYRWLRSTACGITRANLERIENHQYGTPIIQWISSNKEGKSQKRVDPSSNNARDFECFECERIMPGCFFAKNQFKYPDGPTCWACKLREEIGYVENTSNHGYADDIEAATQWLGPCPDLSSCVLKAESDLAKPLVNDKTYYQIRQEIEKEKERIRQMEMGSRPGAVVPKWGSKRGGNFVWSASPEERAEQYRSLYDQHDWRENDWELAEQFPYGMTQEEVPTTWDW